PSEPPPRSWLALKAALVVVVERAVRPPLAVAEAKTLIEPPRGDIALGGGQLHVVGAALACMLEGAAHELAPEAASAQLGHDEQLGQVALEAVREYGGPEAGHGGPARAPV